ncbi:MAG TPA: DUF5916 domain-containing protein [Vicinamibacteria bacterium]|nr:DUF5916 domain-containing protein [Vicinamibacteria bacterium]
MPLLLTAALASAQDFVPWRPTIEIQRVEIAPTLDDFLDMKPSPRLEGRMTRLSGFKQRSPSDGAESTKPTDVYLGYDDEHLYVVFVAFDDQPEQVRARLSRRETVDRDDDLVYVNLDTFNDERRGYEFGTNALGVQFDSLFIEGGEVDRTFDTLWYSEGQRTDRGFVVWFALPFESLRFPDAPRQTWGILLERWSAHSSDWSFWPQASSRIDGFLAQTGRIEMEGVEAGRNVQLIPYGLNRSYSTLEEEDLTDANVGLDAKVVFRESLVLDGTVNPDFSQVESDEPQVTVNQRFEVFFPEKRPFFIENAQYFQTPLNLVFTRRIADPELGARLTGKAGPWAIGAIFADDEAPGKAVPSASPLFGSQAKNGILRVARDVFQQGTVGMIFTDRELEGAWNRVGGADFRFKLDPNWSLTGQAVASATRLAEGLELDGPAYALELDRNGRHFQTSIEYLDVADGFRAENGFVTRRDIRSGDVFAQYTFWPEGDKLISWGPSISLQRIWDHAGTKLDDLFEAEVEFQFHRQTTASVSWVEKEEVLRPKDFATLLENRAFPQNAAELELATSYFRAVTLRLEASRGTTIHFTPPSGEAPETADADSFNLTLTLRPWHALTIDNTFLSTALSSPDDGETIFRNRILRTKWNWQWNRELSFRVIVQYDEIDASEAATSLPAGKNLNFDVLATYLVNPGTALFAGYNGNGRSLDLEVFPRARERFTAADGLTYDAWQVFVKFSYLFRF